MPVLIVIALLVVWFIWANWGRRKAQAELDTRLNPIWARMTRSKPCQWELVHADKRQKTGSLREFRCRTCKVTAYSTGNKGPVECKKGLGGGL